MYESASRPGLCNRRGLTKFVVAMSRIDQQTIDRIMDATDIVDVIGDFVSLKKRGANYWGLCPFHNDRSPSFSVSRAKGIFKCFSCGKAGSALSFLIDLESMSYVEAIRWLARKYGIEIKEREMTSNERRAEAERESMFAVNEFALEHFEKNLTGTEDGRAIGLAYFRERGIGDAMIRKFHLGYAIDRPDDLMDAAIKAGYKQKALEDTGLVIRTDSGRCYDRFKGRVIYPVHSLSGRIVAFGGRTLRKEKTLAKYVNSPESAIYSKGREIYGMYQARQAIAKTRTCILVEGYMDVISMHQSGVENVVASSGTALTEGQVTMIKRFADKVVLMYDSDAAGIKAALRGINMFVAAGINPRLVLLPEGEDPDSFAQSHTSAEVEEYIAAHEQDLINFKADILMRDASGDPRRRTEAINDILTTVSMIPDIVEQSLYIDECARRVGVDASTLAAQVKVFIARRREDEYNRRSRAAAASTVADIIEPVAPEPEKPAAPQAPVDEVPRRVREAERDLIRYVVRRGLMYMCDVYPDNDASEAVPMSVIDYIERELQTDGTAFSTPLYATLWKLALEIRDMLWPERNRAIQEEAARCRDEFVAARRRELLESGADSAAIMQQEPKISADADAVFTEAVDSRSSAFIAERLMRHPDRAVTDAVISLTADPVVLSRMYPREDVRKDLCEKVPMAVYTLKGALLKEELDGLCRRLKDNPPTEVPELTALLERIRNVKQLSMEFDLYNGEIVITPPQRR